MELEQRFEGKALSFRARSRPVHRCPHCKEGGDLIIGKYITISIQWDPDDSCWHCLICGFIGFGTDFDLIQYPLVACVGRGPRLPGESRKKRFR